MCTLLLLLLVVVVTIIIVVVVLQSKICSDMAFLLGLEHQ